MILWLAKFLLGWPWCLHKWAILSQRSLSLHHGSGDPSTGQRFYLQCAKCGDVTKRDLA